jgi:metal-responsive CopG/Arc/MetJ family transcriptional regulator
MWIIIQEKIMKTIQMTLDEKLLRDVDKVTKKLKTTRSKFIRRAMHKLLDELEIKELEKLHREGYKKYPVKQGEFDIWENEQSWV